MNLSHEFICLAILVIGIAGVVVVVTLRKQWGTFILFSFIALWHGGFAAAGGYVGWNMAHSSNFILAAAASLVGATLGLVAGFLASLLLGAIADFFLL